MEEIIVNSFFEYLEKIKPYTNKGYSYRGLKDFEYPLIPSVGRYKYNRSETDMIDTSVKKKEMIAFNNFKREYVSYLPFAKRNDFEILSIAQHHGLPTRLMDWTSNPLTALFFSVEKIDEIFEGDSVVYALRNYIAINHDSNFPDIDPFKLTRTYGFMPSHITPNITAQDGLFTIHNEPTVEFNEDTMTKIRIKNKARLEIKSYLYQYGITRKSLFPDLYGLTAKLKSQIFELIDPNKE